MVHTYNTTPIPHYLIFHQAQKHSIWYRTTSYNTRRGISSHNKTINKVHQGREQHNTIQHTEQYNTALSCLTAPHHTIRIASKHITSQQNNTTQHSTGQNNTVLSCGTRQGRTGHKQAHMTRHYETIYSTTPHRNIKTQKPTTICTLKFALDNIFS